MSFFDRLRRSTPVWSQLLGRKKPFIRSAMVTGVSAGEHAVDGIHKGDQLVSVLLLHSSLYAQDQTSEFAANTDANQRIQRDGYIDNTGGSNLTSWVLWVTWLSWKE